MSQRKDLTPLAIQSSGRPSWWPRTKAGVAEVWLPFSLAAGTTLLIALLLQQGVSDVWTAFATAGWGLALVAAYHLVPMIADAYAWRPLFAATPRPGFITLTWVRWLGESVNTLLPVAQIGGEVIRSRLLALRGIPASHAGAAVVADVTLGLFTQIAFTLLGIGLLVVTLGTGQWIWPALGAALLMAVLATAFYFAQRRGLFAAVAGRLEILIGTDRLVPAAGARDLDATLTAIYVRRAAVARAAAWRLTGWLAGAGEVWLALYFIGAPVGPVEALILESLGQAVRGMAFLVPAALGVQEGGFVLIGSLLGISPEVALALSLVKRVRELALGIPGLLVWQALESRTGWRRLRGLQG